MILSGLHVVNQIIINVYHDWGWFIEPIEPIKMVTLEMFDFLGYIGFTTSSFMGPWDQGNTSVVLKRPTRGVSPPRSVGIFHVPHRIELSSGYSFVNGVAIGAICLNYL